MPVYRTIALAVAGRIEGPYTDHPLISYEVIKRDSEEPDVFFYDDSYYMIAEDHRVVEDALEGNPIPEKQIKRGQ